MLRRLQPDERELKIAATISLEPCPFCGAQPIAWTEVNDSTGFHVGKVACTDCHGGIDFCMPTREDAREGAIKCWNKRAR